MQKIAALAGTALLLALSAGSALAGERPVCLKAQRLAQNPATANQNVRGFVRSIVGDVLTIEQKDGKARTVTVSKRERAAIGQILGSEVIVTPVFCNRISFAPPPPPVIQRPRPIQFPQSRPPAPTPPRPVPQTAPPLPRPVPAPAVPRPIIPQTW